MAEQRIKQKKNDLFSLGIVIAIVLLVNIINQSFFFRLDLTAEKRYTLSKSTRDILRNLDDIVFIKVYLEGDLNIPFRKFRQSISDLLDEFKIYGKTNFQYTFENPFEDATGDQQKRIIKELLDKGLTWTNILKRDNEGGFSEKIIFPGALLTYKNVEIPLNLLVNDPEQNAEQNLINSQEVLEYTLISNIRNITNDSTRKIAFIEGHGELHELEVLDISNELSRTYQIDRGSIRGIPGVLDEYRAVIVAAPTVPFSEQDKFVLDQYLMQGGRILWLLDAVDVSLDSLVNGETLAFIRELNLEDMLFKYGVRINPELIQDIQCGVIAVNVALAGNPPNFQLVPWLYKLLLTPNPDHPISHNMNLVLGSFSSPIDTIAARKNIKKSVLLSTSIYTKTRKLPALISLAEIRETPDRKEFSGSQFIVGTLLEGEFESVFTNRGLDQYFPDPPKITEKSVPTRMAVIADGDVIRNNVRFSEKGPSIDPLGYDRYSKQTYANREFLTNLVQYLADDNNLLELRGREFRLRLLDKEKIRSERKKWIILNMLIPSLIILLCGGIFISYRKRRYAH
jgi:ABC-2 type transport system permease protein